MHYQELKERIHRHYSLNPIPSEYASLLDKLKSTDSWIETVFPYDWVSAILSYPTSIDILNEELTLIRFEGAIETEMAFPSNHGSDLIKDEFLLLQIEQAARSPHRYMQVPANTSIIDVGASEGIFSRRYCHKDNEIHMFDSEEWIHAAMFNVDHDEVYYHTDLVTPDYCIDFELGKPLGCIKIDVDGPELDVIEKFKDWIIQYKPMMQVAVYHRQQELEEVVNALSQLGYSEFYSPEGYMLDPNDDYQYAPYFRKGLIIAK